MHIVDSIPLRFQNWKTEKKLINTPNNINIYSKRIFWKRKLHFFLLIYIASFQLEIKSDTKDENYRKDQVELVNEKEEASMPRW